MSLLMQSEVQRQYEEEFEAFQSGKYKESAQNWLQSSWQGDALQVCQSTFSFLSWLRDCCCIYSAHWHCC